MMAVVLGRCTYPFLINSNSKSNYLIVNYPLVFSSKLQRHLLGDSDDHIQHGAHNHIQDRYFIHDLQLKKNGPSVRMSEKLCLQWNDFKENVSCAFGKLRDGLKWTQINQGQLGGSLGVHFRGP